MSSGARGPDDESPLSKSYWPRTSLPIYVRRGPATMVAIATRAPTAPACRSDYRRSGGKRASTPAPAWRKCSSRAAPFLRAGTGCLIFSLVLFAALVPNRSLLSSMGQLQPSSFEGEITVFRARTPSLAVELSFSSRELFSILTRGRVVCSDGSTHRQRFAEGIPDPKHRVRTQADGYFHYAVVVPEDPVSASGNHVSAAASAPNYDEAMQGRVFRSRVAGRMRFSELTLRGGHQVRCGTRAPSGHWMPFVAQRFKGPPLPRHRRFNAGTPSRIPIRP